MSDICCGGFGVEETTVESVPNAIFRPLDDCGDKAIYMAEVGGTFVIGTPVSFDPNKVAPGFVTTFSDDGSNQEFAGISLSDVTAIAGTQILVQRTGHVRWSDIAAGFGSTASNKGDWWGAHIALAKINIYVEFK